MGNKKYNKYSENFKETENVVTEEVEEVVTEEVVTEEVEEVVTEEVEEVVTEEVEEVVEDEPKAFEIHVDDIQYAVVTNCAKLNVRKEAAKDSEVVCVLANGTEVTVNIDASTDSFYKVYTTCKDVLVEGYCVKEFIEIK